MTHQPTKTERSTLCDQRKLIVCIFSAFQFFPSQLFAACAWAKDERDRSASVEVRIECQITGPNVLTKVILSIFSLSFILLLPVHINLSVSVSRILCCVHSLNCFFVLFLYHFEKWSRKVSEKNIENTYDPFVGAIFGLLKIVFSLPFYLCDLSSGFLVGVVIAFFR